MLSQSTFFFIHHNCQIAAHTYKYTLPLSTEAFAGMISVVVAPDKFCVLWELDLKQPQNHMLTHQSSPFRQVTVNCLYYIPKVLQIPSKLAHILVCYTMNTYTFSHPSSLCLKPHFGLFNSEDFARSLAVVQS